MTYLLLYCPPIYKVSGGLNNFKMFFDICKGLNVKVLYCPLLKNVPSLNFSSPFTNIPFEQIKQSQIYEYFNIDGAQTINNDDIVTVEILCKRDNVIVYAEDVIGNPAEQKYVVRWLLFFPIQKAVISYNFNDNLIYFFSDYIYNFYKHLCKNIGIKDMLTSNIKKINICRVFKFNKNDYTNLNINRINTNNIYTNKCFSIRKFFPPYTFNNLNINHYLKNLDNTTQIEIRKYTNNKILKLQSQIKRINNNNKIALLNITDSTLVNKKRIELNKLIVNKINYQVVQEYWKNKFVNHGYEEIGWKSSPIEFVDYFKTKSLFVTLDPFTFISIISALTGCISVIKKINGLDFHEWCKGDPFNNYGIAYGMDNIDHALKTRHLLLEHIDTMYNQNIQNVINMISDIQQKFSVTLF
jgi:hypothetical protein